MTTANTLLAVEGLTLKVTRSGIAVVKDVSLSLAPGEILGIVGESGSGKTLAARSIVQLQPPAIAKVAGTVRFEGRDVAAMSDKELRDLRGGRIGMVFQEPMTSLNPSMTIGRQLEEGLVLHRSFGPEERRRLILDMLTSVGLRDPESALDVYPHVFSGGMRQRIMLASVMLLEPALLIADEPTTALDAVIQRDVLDLMVNLTKAHNTAVLMISHDLSMVARYTDRVIVMREGEIVEQGRTEEILRRPQHGYTRKLLAAMPRRAAARVLPSSEALVEVRDLVVDYSGRQGFFRNGATKRALGGVSLSVRPREVVAVVGGSGSGKTTLGRAIAGLVKPSAGEVRYAGHPVRRGSAEWRDFRLNCQMIFQDPYASLDPRMTVGDLVGEALLHVPGLTRREKRARVTDCLDEVGLGGPYADRFPHELSGGQRQRVAIARAVIRRPAFVIADEPVSALDVTVRAQILDLFAELQNRHGFSCLFISHDLGVVEQAADRVIVMNDGAIVEEGDRDSIFDRPQEPYTRRLLSAIPALETTAEGGVRLKWRLDAEADAAANTAA